MNDARTRARSLVTSELNGDRVLFALLKNEGSKATTFLQNKRRSQRAKRSSKNSQFPGSPTLRMSEGLREQKYRCYQFTTRSKTTQ